MLISTCVLDMYGQVILSWVQNQEPDTVGSTSLVAGSIAPNLLFSALCC